MGIQYLDDPPLIIPIHPTTRAVPVGSDTIVGRSIICAVVVKDQNVSLILASCGMSEANICREGKRAWFGRQRQMKRIRAITGVFEY